MIDRLAAAARRATDAYAAGDGLWMLEGGVRSDAFFRDIVRAVLTELREPDMHVICAIEDSDRNLSGSDLSPDELTARGWTAGIDAILFPKLHTGQDSPHG